MATVFRIRWLITVHMLELALRVVFLIALFTRPVGCRAVRVLPPGTPGLRG